MSSVFEQLDPRDQKWVMEELREILSDPDQANADRRRAELADRLRPDHPDVAAWIEEQDGAEPDERPSLIETLPVDDERISALVGKTVLLKYGGNAMVDESVKQSVIQDICTLKSVGITPVVVHGGGPVISELLGKVGVKSRFIGGHRKTDRTMMAYVEMALSGRVNSEIVKLIGFNGFKSVGISGKDGAMVTAEKRIHKVREGQMVRRSDLGQVGDVKSINTDLVESLIEHDYIPVIAPIGVGEDLEDYNINADMFAGHMAAALGAEALVVLTDVDGIFLDIEQPGTLIPEFTTHAAREEIGRIIQGGMIPKVEACLIALEGGVGRAHIINGMAAHSMLEILLTGRPRGTTVRADNERDDH
ncbi:MAG: Acetylglutamate kinase [Calditrichaeota bacterium]|nr:Acetylglutamate kinase [Calditrichota bacterium]